MNGPNHGTLTIEDITRNKAVSFGKHKGTIQTLLYDEVTGTLFAGDITGRIKQYKRGNSGNPFSLLKDFGDVAIGQVYSSAQVGAFAFFGGEFCSVVAIDIYKRLLCKGTVKSAFWRTFCLQVCQGLNSKLYLSAGAS